MWVIKNYRWTNYAHRAYEGGPRDISVSPKRLPSKLSVFSVVVWAVLPSMLGRSHIPPITLASTLVQAAYTESMNVIASIATVAATACQNSMEPDGTNPPTVE